MVAPSPAFKLSLSPALDPWSARTALTHFAGPAASCVTVRLDAAGLSVGDRAGLALFTRSTAAIGLQRTASAYAVVRLDATRRWIEAASLPGPKAWLRISCNVEQREALLLYSADGRHFTPLGDPHPLSPEDESLPCSLFGLAAAGRPSSGVAVFDRLLVEAPGLERKADAAEMRPEVPAPAEPRGRRSSR